MIINPNLWFHNTVLSKTKLMCTIQKNEIIRDLTILVDLLNRQT